MQINLTPLRNYPTLFMASDDHSMRFGHFSVSDERRNGKNNGQSIDHERKTKND